MAYWISCGVVSQQEVNARGGGTDLIYVLQDDQEVKMKVHVHVVV